MGVEYLGPLDQEELRKWRARDSVVVVTDIPYEDDHYKPDTTGTSKAHDGVAEIEAPAPIRKENPRAVVEKAGLRFATWLKKNPHVALAKARKLKAENPMQFSHMTDEQLAEALPQMMFDKAREIAEREAKRQGWYDNLYSGGIIVP